MKRLRRFIGSLKTVLVANTSARRAKSRTQQFSEQRLNRVIPAAALARWAGIENSAGREVTNLATTLVAITDRDEIAGDTRLWIVVSANGSARAVTVEAAWTP